LRGSRAANGRRRNRQSKSKTPILFGKRLSVPAASLRIRSDDLHRTLRQRIQKSLAVLLGEDAIFEFVVAVLYGFLQSLRLQTLGILSALNSDGL